MVDFPIRTLGELAAPFRAAVAIGPFGSRMKAEMYVPYGVPVIRGTNIGPDKALSGGWVYVTDEFADGIPNCQLRPGDLVFPHRGSIGEVALVQEHHGKMLLSSSMMKISPDPKQADSRFLYYYFKGTRGREEILRFGSQVGTPGIGQPLASLKQFRVPLPDLAVQKRVAEILSKLDDKIELNRQMNETLEAMAQAIFRDWFVDFGPTRRKLEGATDPLTIMGGLAQDTERAQALADLFPTTVGDEGLPEGWENKPLLDQANWVNGAAYKNMHFSDATDALPVVKIAELKNGVTGSTKRTNTALGERYRISDGELLFSWSGNPDTSIDAFVWIGGDAWLNQHIFAVRENGTRSRAALYVLLKALMPQFAELARNKQTTGLGHVTKEDMKRLEIAIAPGSVEAAFEEVITPTVSLIVSKLIENKTLAATRDLLLPKLMSGEIRLAEAEGLVEAAQ